MANLKVQEKAHQVTLLVYQATQSFPPSERFGLVSQMRRAAYSVGANLAEGGKRRSAKDRLRFHEHAVGSLEELKYFIRLCGDLNLLEKTQTEAIFEAADEVSRMLYSLNRFLQAAR